MAADDKVDILLVDDQPAKLLSYEVILQGLGENLLKADSARQALEHLLRTEVAVVLVDVQMPELDGFELAAMIREHPRFRQTAIIFVSAVHLTEFDRLRGYESGAVDYVPVPVVPEILRAKVKVFAELYRKTRQLARLNADLERHVAERTAELEASTAKLRESEQRRSLALAAGRMGSWDWELQTGACTWDEGQHRIFGVDPGTFVPTADAFWSMIHLEDREALRLVVRQAAEAGQAFDAEFRICRPTRELRWCILGAAPTIDEAGHAARLSGITYDITDRKLAEERRQLLVKELNHRVKNTLAVVQSIALQTGRVHLSPERFQEALGARLQALARAHDLLTREAWEGISLADLVGETLAPYGGAATRRVEFGGPDVRLTPNAAVTLNMAFHELATNAAKYGAMANGSGRLSVSWSADPVDAPSTLQLEWVERDGPPVAPPSHRGFGTRLVEQGLAHELDCDVRLAFAREGVECRIRVPLSGKVILA